AIAVETASTYSGTRASVYTGSLNADVRGAPHVWTPILAVFSLLVAHWMKYQAASLCSEFAGIPRPHIQCPVIAPWLVEGSIAYPTFPAICDWLGSSMAGANRLASMKNAALPCWKSVVASGQSSDSAFGGPAATSAA